MKRHGLVSTLPQSPEPRAQTPQTKVFSRIYSIHALEIRASNVLEQGFLHNGRLVVFKWIGVMESAHGIGDIGIAITWKADTEATTDETLFK